MKRSLLIFLLCLTSISCGEKAELSNREVLAKKSTKVDAEEATEIMIIAWACGYYYKYKSEQDYFSKADEYLELGDFWSDFLVSKIDFSEESADIKNKKRESILEKLSISKSEMQKAVAFDLKKGKHIKDELAKLSRNGFGKSVYKDCDDAYVFSRILVDRILTRHPEE